MSVETDMGKGGDKNEVLSSFRYRVPYTHHSFDCHFLQHDCLGLCGRIYLLAGFKTNLEICWSI